MLDIQHLSFAVTNEAAGKEILHDITLTVDSGRFVVITGPNGGGKSTLAKMIAGIEKPTAGKILLDGTDMTDLSITDRAKLGVSYAFQQPVRFKGITVRDLLTIASGDSHNDLGMIQASKAGFLFKSTEQIKKDHPELPAYETYDELMAAIKSAL